MAGWGQVQTVEGGSEKGEAKRRCRLRPGLWPPGGSVGLDGVGVGGGRGCAFAWDGTAIMSGGKSRLRLLSWGITQSSGQWGK